MPFALKDHMHEQFAVEFHKFPIWAFYCFLYSYANDLPNRLTKTTASDANADDTNLHDTASGNSINDI